jgi:uncharacterized membrane protein
MKITVTPKQIALTAIFAALYFALNFITPIAIPVGVQGLSITVSALIATIFGLIIGPYLGTASAFLGAAISWSLTGMSPLGLPFLLSPPLNAFVSGSIFYKKWKMAIIPFVILMVAFLFTPPVLSFGNAQVAIWVLWDKIIAVLLIVPVVMFSKRLSAGQGAALFFLIAFIGNQADNMWGSFAFSLPVVYNGIFGMQMIDVQFSFLAAPFLYPAIRLVEAFIIMAISVPLMKGLNNTTWLWKKDHIFTPPIKQQLT